MGRRRRFACRIVFFQRWFGFELAHSMAGAGLAPHRAVGNQRSFSKTGRCAWFKRTCYDWFLRGSNPGFWVDSVLGSDGVAAAIHDMAISAGRGPVFWA